MIVNEVLAVGDAEFQKKCLGKMNEVSEGEGRTILFVSHNMAAIKSLCTKGIVLDKGLFKFSGDTTTAVSKYFNNEENNSNNLRNYTDIFVENIFKLNKISVSPSKIYDRDIILESDEVELKINIDVLNNDSHQYHITFHLYNEVG